MKRRLLKMALLGALLGVAVDSLISALTADGLPVTAAYLARIGDLRAALLLKLLLVGLFGAVCMAGTLLYDAERLSVTAATLLHCGLCIAPFVPLSLFLGWCSSAAELLIMTGCQLAAFFCIWLIIYARYRKEVRALNDMQKDYLKDSEQLTVDS